MAIFDILDQGINYLDRGLSNLGQSVREKKLETFGSNIFGGDREGFSREELQAEFDENKRVYVDHVVEHYSTQLINKLGLHGFDIYKPEFITTYSYTIETLRACLYQSIDLYHPFKEHIDEITEELEIEGLDDDFD